MERDAKKRGGGNQVSCKSNQKSCTFFRNAKSILSPTQENAIISSKRESFRTFEGISKSALFFKISEIFFNEKNYLYLLK